MKKRIYPILLLFIFLQLFLGCDENKVAGTSTSTENTIAGTIVYGEKALVGARVSLRASNVLPNSITETKNEVKTDSLGHFEFKAASGVNYTLYAKAFSDSIYSAVCYKTNIVFRADERHLVLDTLMARNSGGLRGVILDSVSQLTTLSIGILGTDNYVNLDAHGHFKLSDLTDGKNQLVLFSRSSMHGHIILEDVVLNSAEELTLDTIVLPPAWENSPTTPFRPNACQEVLVSLAQGDSSSRGVIDSSLLLYTLFPGSHPKLVEMDLCKAKWYPKVLLLPGLADFIQLFHFNSLFYLNDGGKKYFQRINLATKLVDTLPITQNLSLATSNKNKLMATFHNDSLLKVFNSSAEFLNGIYQDSFPLPPTQTQQLALHNDTAFFLGPGFLQRFVLPLRTMDTTFHPIIHKQNWNGMAVNTKGKIFLLGEHNMLFKVQSEKPFHIDTIQIVADSIFRGLSSP